MDNPTDKQFALYSIVKVVVFVSVCLPVVPSVFKSDPEPIYFWNQHLQENIYISIYCQFHLLYSREAKKCQKW